MEEPNKVLSDGTVSLVSEDLDDFQVTLPSAKCFRLCGLFLTLILNGSDIWFKVSETL